MFSALEQPVWTAVTSERMENGAVYRMTTAFEIVIDVNGIIFSQEIGPTLQNGTTSGRFAAADLDAPVVGDVIRYEYQETIDIFRDFSFEADVAGLTWSISSLKVSPNINFAPVPEPSTALLLGLGLIGIGIRSRKRAG